MEHGLIAEACLYNRLMPEHRLKQSCVFGGENGINESVDAAPFTPCTLALPGYITVDAPCFRNGGLLTPLIPHVAFHSLMSATANQLQLWGSVRGSLTDREYSLSEHVQ